MTQGSFEQSPGDGHRLDVPRKPGMKRGLDRPGLEARTQAPHIDSPDATHGIGRALEPRSARPGFIRLSARGRPVEITAPGDGEVQRDIESTVRFDARDAQLLIM